MDFLIHRPAFCSDPGAKSDCVVFQGAADGGHHGRTDSGGYYGRAQPGFVFGNAGRIFRASVVFSFFLKKTYKRQL